MQTEHNLASTLAPSVGVATDDTVASVKKMSVKTTNSVAKISDGGGVAGGGGVGSTDEGVEPVKRDADAYQEARTYVFLEVELHKPLITKRPASVLTER